MKVEIIKGHWAGLVGFFRGYEKNSPNLIVEVITPGTGVIEVNMLPNEFKIVE